MRRRHLESVSSRSLSVRGSWGAAPKRKLGDPTWSAARDDAYAQKGRPASEAYRSSPCGDSATPPGDHKFTQ